MSAVKTNVNLILLKLAVLLASFGLTAPANAAIPKPSREAVSGIASQISSVSTQNSKNSPFLAQVPTVPQNAPPPNIITPPKPPTPQIPTTPLPPPDQLLPELTPTPQTPETETSPSNVPGQIVVKRFEFEGNTAFSTARLQQELEKFTNTPLTFSELLQARTAITDLYIKNGYQTSGALIPPQTLESGIVTIQVVEGKLEDIKISFSPNSTTRLNPNYVRSRIRAATSGALNIPKLLEGLRLLQLDPLITNLSAELSAGSRPGTSLLSLQITEADTFSSQVNYNNNRSPSVGSIRRGVQLREGNVLGLGDAFTIGYGNTDGSDSLDLSYNLPVNGRNGTISLSYGNTSSRVIEQPFDVLDIQASSRYFDVTYRQPFIQSPSQEFAFGITGSRRETDTSFLRSVLGEALPFPSPGSDEQGRTRLTALRFFQDWTQRGAKQVISARSQFSLGIGAFNATLNENPPDSRFFSWRGQAQWVRLLAADTLMLVRGDVQFANKPLLSVEQYGLGGQDTIPGYRQDSLLTDNGVLFGTEVRIPVLRFAKTGLVQLAPFADVGRGWNSGESVDPDPQTIASVGMGLQFNWGTNLSARLDYGIPLVVIESEKRTLQEKGFHFSILFSPF